MSNPGSPIPPEGPLGPPPPRPESPLEPLNFGRNEAKGLARKPTVFSGDRKNLEKFIRDSSIYASANEKDLPTPQTKTQFLLSYIDGGEADTWKEYFFNRYVVQPNGSYHWPTPEEVIASLRANFTKEDEIEESLRKLETMKQGSRTAEEIINEFRILKARAKIEDSPLTVRMFRRILNPSLAMKILTDADKPITLEDIHREDGTFYKYGWFSKAIQYDQIYRDARSAQNQDRGGNYDNRNRNFRQAVQKGNERSSWRPTRVTPYKDPNAMDIDVVTTTINAMTYEERGEYLKKGLCFNCKQPGHLSRDCPKKNFRRSTSNSVEPPRYIQN